MTENKGLYYVSLVVVALLEKALCYADCPVVILGIGGVSQSGKSRVAHAIIKDLRDTSPLAAVQQDSFWKGSVVNSSDTLRAYGDICTDDVDDDDDDQITTE